MSVIPGTQPSLIRHMQLNTVASQAADGTSTALPMAEIIRRQVENAQRRANQPSPPQAPLQAPVQVLPRPVPSPIVQAVMVPAPQTTFPRIIPSTVSSAMASASAMAASLVASAVATLPSLPIAQVSAQSAASAAANLILEASDQDGDPLVQEREALYTTYVPKCVGYKHISELVQTTTLGYALPKLDTELLHPNVKSNPNVSSAQLDAVGYACMADAKGLGFLLGDGTGAGKGRVLAACMLNRYSWNPDQNYKHIIVTASAGLEKDFLRDIVAIGIPTKGKKALPIRSLTEWKVEEKIKLPRGILFVTYSALRAASNASGKKRKSKSGDAASLSDSAPLRSRLDQILEWASSGPDGMTGVVAFDEVHSCKDAKTATSKAAVRLQNELPNAQVVYASATAMSSVEHVSAMTRLGLFGPNTAYPTLDEFLTKWNQQTRSGLEIIATELAAQGLYIARRLSFEGTKFRMSHAEMSESQFELHRKLCRWWMDLADIKSVLVGQKERARLWGAHLRFFKALLVAYRVDHCVDLVKESIANGGSVVISLIGTGEAVAKRLLDELTEDSVEDGFVALQEIMKSVIDHAIDTFEGESLPERVLELKKDVESFNLPPSPLDYLISKLERITDSNGKRERVVEMTGRKGGFYQKDDGKWEYKLRTVKNDDGCRIFQSGKCHIAVISAAASTGISLQNETSKPNRHRTQFIIELPWAADQAMQALGRTHRADQHDPPDYVLITSRLRAEERFASTVSKRAADLGAATTGDRRGSNQEEAFGSDLLVGTHAVEGIRKMTTSVLGRTWPKWLGHEPDEDWNVFSNQVAGVLAKIGIHPASQPKQFLGRLLGVEFEISNKCMRLYEAACVEAQINSEYLKRRTNTKTDIGVEDVCIGEKTRVVKEGDFGAVEIATDVGVTFDDALEKARQWENDGGTFKFATRTDVGKERVFNVIARIEAPRVRITRPNGRESLMFIEDFDNIYTVIKKDPDGDDEFKTAREKWEEEHELTLHQCGHGKHCKFGSVCTFGKREMTTTLVKMPGALNSLCNYVGTRQIIRYSDSSRPDVGTERCVAVRISNTHITPSLESDLQLEKERIDAQKKRSDDAKSRMLKSKSNVVESSSSEDEEEDEDWEMPNVSLESGLGIATTRRAASLQAKAAAAASQSDHQSDLAIQIDDSSSDEEEEEKDDLPPPKRQKEAINLVSSEEESEEGSEAEGESEGESERLIESEEESESD